MKPLRLEIVGFGPYADKQVIDFELLSQHQIYTVAGKTGSGKTAIFDALFFALFSALPGRRDNILTEGLRCTETDPDIEGYVTFDFFAKGNIWRVKRTPGQYRAARHEDRLVKIGAKVEMYRKTESGFEGLTLKGTEVSAKCVELIGLDASQFERVVLLPQGEFERILTESGSQRQTLLRTIFGTQIYEQLAAEIDTRAKELRNENKEAQIKLERDLSNLDKDLTSLEKQREQDPPTNLDNHSTDSLRAQEGPGLPFNADSSDSDTAASSSDPTETTTGAGAGAATPAAKLSVESLSQRLNAVSTYLPTLKTRNDEAEAKHQSNLKRLKDSEKEIELAQRHKKLVDRLAALAQKEPELAEAKRRADQANRFRPSHKAVQRQNGLKTKLLEARSALIRCAQNAQIQIDWLNSRVHADLALPKAANKETQHSLETALSALRDQHQNLLQQQGSLNNELVDLPQLEQDHQLAHKKLDDLNKDIETLSESIASAKESVDKLGAKKELTGLEAALKTADIQLEAAEKTLLLDQAIAAKTATLTNQKGLIIQAGEALEQSRVALEKQPDLDKALNEAQTGLTRVEEIADKRSQLSALQTEIARTSKTLAEHQKQRDDLVERYMSSSAFVLAETLEDNEPCPVCGSSEHPQPAQPGPDSSVPSQEQLDQAQSAFEAQQRKDSELATRLTTLTAAIPQELLAVNDADFETKLTEAQKLLETTRETAQQNRLCAKEHQTRNAALDNATKTKNDLETELNKLSNARSGAVALLGAGTDQPETQHFDPEIYKTNHLKARNSLEEARKHNKNLDESSARLEELHTKETKLKTEHVEADKTCALAKEALGAKTRDIKAAQETYNTALTKFFTIDNQHIAQQIPPAAEPAISPEVITECKQKITSLRETLAQHRSELSSVAEVESQLSEAEGDTNKLLDELELESTQALETYPDIDAQECQEIINRYTQHLTQQAETKQDLEQLPAPKEPLPDLAEINKDLEETKQRASKANSELALFKAGIERVSTGIADSAKLEEEHQAHFLKVHQMQKLSSQLKGGDGAKNLVGLENWVLSKHLRQVVELANERLKRSTRNRFELVVKDRNFRKTGLHGLEIGVLDRAADNPTERQIQSLSGGELFQASLAMALGMADAVMRQSAATSIEAMFIDEGFGSLDGDSLDMAIEVLGELKASATSVAVITHVKELLDNLPKGLTVERDPSGATSTIRCALKATQQTQVVP